MRQEISITVDTVIFKPAENGEGQEVLLIQRKNDPYKDQWALPGGFLEKEEFLEDGAKRELEEETGLKIGAIEQIGVFDSPNRDPRGRTISVAYLGFAKASDRVKGTDDAKAAKWFKINKLPKLAFDHEQIMKKASDIISTKEIYSGNSFFVLALVLLS